jgi:hypothetical protein
MMLSILCVALLEVVMTRSRGILPGVLSVVLSLTILITPVWGSPIPALGSVIYAEKAHVGAVPASVGTTVFKGDTLNTEKLGSVQVRAGAARLMLAESSRVALAEEAGSPAATLTGGTATFSTANSKAFALHVATAVIRPEGNAPTIGSVTVLNPKELVVRCSRGALTISVEDDVRVVPEGTAYRVVLDPNPDNADAAPAQPWGQNRPVRAGKSHFIWYVIAFAAIVTAVGVHFALESPVEM